MIDLENAGTPLAHNETLGDKWFPFIHGPNEIPGVVATVLQEGASRPAWNCERSGLSSSLVVWPRETLLRAGVVVQAEEGKEPGAKVCIPFLEGLPNDMTVEEVYRWQDKVQGEVCAQPADDSAPLWFYDPLFFRDAYPDLSPGVTHTFLLGGLCYGMRRALLDEMTVAKGPVFEAHAAKWLSENPGKTSRDVPPLKVPLVGARILGPAGFACEYQARCTIMDLDTFDFGPEGAKVKVHRFVAEFGNPGQTIQMLLFAPETVCAKGYEPKEGHEVDVIFWLQGRVADLPPETEAAQDETEKTAE